MLGRELGEAAPATSDFKNRLSLGEVQHLCQRAIFVGLGLVERVCAVGKDRRRIGHRVIQPTAVERISKIVMRFDVLARTAPGIAIEPVGELLDQARDRALRQQLLDEFVIAAKQFEKRCDVGAVPLAVEIGLSESYVALPYQLAGEIEVMHDHFCVRARMRALNQIDPFVWRADFESAMLELRGQ